MKSQDLIFEPSNLDSGIYRIIAQDGYFYIGSSRKILKRWAEHKNKLLRNGHENQHIQRRFNKYNQVWTFALIEPIEKTEDILEREQFYLDIYINDPKCMNLNPTASKPPPQKGKSFTSIHIAKIILKKVLNGVYRKANIDESLLKLIMLDINTDPKIKKLCSTILTTGETGVEFVGSTLRGSKNLKMSERMKGNTFSKGRVGTFLGKKHTEASKEKIRLARINRKK